jgi:hypothetical protein
MQFCSAHRGDGVGNLTVHIKLELLARGIANANWSRPTKSLEPGQLALRQMPFPVHAVHDLHLPHITSY